MMSLTHWPTLLLAQATESAPAAAMQPEFAGGAGPEGMRGVMSLINVYAIIFVVAFAVTLIATPIVRRIATATGVVDKPDATRKSHGYPVAYLGGVAVFLGVIVAIAVSYIVLDDVPLDFGPVPIAVVLGMVAVMFTGLADDVWNWDPHLKLAGQLVAAAALAIENVGVRVAAGVLNPVASQLDPILGSENLVFLIPTPWGEPIPLDVIYWVGTAIIALFVLGGCNAVNFIDGLDGLASGVVAIAAMGFLAIALLMAVSPSLRGGGPGVETLDGARIVLCCALLGSVLAFLPYNFNPATIFLGDCGSHLLGYLCVVIILMLGEHGQTHLVFAGLIVFSLPIMDTTLAIIRRRLSGRPISSADSQHLHHQLRRALKTVKRAVLALYVISFAFMALGVTLAALVMLTDLRVRAIYAIAFVLFSFVGVIAVKVARFEQRRLMAQANVKAAEHEAMQAAITIAVQRALEAAARKQSETSAAAAGSAARSTGAPITDKPGTVSS
jgi:UDP-GlcNAc:undecaprenyl-phosphate GlcNAc-1-phosphate transferase